MSTTGLFVIYIACTVIAFFYLADKVTTRFHRIKRFEHNLVPLPGQWSLDLSNPLLKVFLQILAYGVAAAFAVGLAVVFASAVSALLISAIYIWDKGHALLLFFFSGHLS